ncbi:hypothetical protein D0Z07_6460 [Hyphodiscus hymeniophilus]|uniref:Uncharacterized protein n=1 Tax=Hyphodiscus hymeniophilus TaxID=353542 RepID=A0A9P6VFD5_9HELO|nr:hypothetical protein D0Z07_6460 [Hyphodiscus hymeniophilus]
MPKKQFLTEPKKRSKHAPQTPSTADEYLAAGVDFEDAGEKWRGGDAVKSTRFFVRAMDCYGEALKKFPTSFDLAHNKARLQYELTQHPKLLAQLPGSLLDLLQTALESSRNALSLKQDNPDVLFNTAQVLTSIVEAISDSRGISIDPLPLLEESLELFQRCLTLQEFQHTESLTQEESLSQEFPDSDNENGGVSIQDATSTSSEPPQDDRWATVLEPITNDTLLDTLLAQLETLTTLCGLINADSGRGLAWIEEYASSLLTTKLPAYLSGTDRNPEAGLTRANFMAAAAEANFRFQRIDVATYSRAIDEAYSPLDLQDNPEGLANKAEAFISYNSSLRLYHYPEEEGMKKVLQSRWQALTTALNALTAASKLPSADNLPKIHLARGDTELSRFQLGQPPNNLESAAKNGSVLVRNAEKFYRGAKALAASAGAAKEGEEAEIKESLAVALAGDAQRLKEAIKLLQSTKAVLEDAIDDGLVSVEQLVGMGIT